jgi:hypothetical protein
VRIVSGKILDSAAHKQDNLFVWEELSVAAKGSRKQYVIANSADRAEQHSWPTSAGTGDKRLQDCCSHEQNEINPLLNSCPNGPQRILPAASVDRVFACSSELITLKT